LDLKITLSPLTESDIPSILEIEYDSQPEPWSERAFLEEINRANSSLLVARFQTAASAGPPAQLIAGYICFWSAAGEIQILNVAVRKTLRRRGIARRLIERAIRTGREQRARLVTLEVRNSNLAARKLYESFGFRQVGERPNYYDVQKESAILMELELESGSGRQTDIGFQVSGIGKRIRHPTSDI
jgi:ribosomal-protein-alanine N-acetyltransferase